MNRCTIVKQQESPDGRGRARGDRRYGVDPQQGIAVLPHGCSAAHAGELFTPPRARPSSGATAGLRQVDGLVHEHGVLARAPALGVLGIDVHDRALPADGAGQDGHADEARRRIGRRPPRRRARGRSRTRPARARSSAIGCPSMRSSIEPAIRQRMPPPLWRCGSATPPGSKSTRSQRIRYASPASSWMGCSSRSVPAASGAAPSRTSSYRSTVAPRGPTAGVVAPPANEALCSASRVSFPPAATVRSPDQHVQDPIEGGKRARCRARRQVIAREAQGVSGHDVAPHAFPARMRCRPKSSMGRTRIADMATRSPVIPSMQPTLRGSAA